MHKVQPPRVPLTGDTALLLFSEFVSAAVFFGLCAAAMTKSPVQYTLLRETASGARAGILQTRRGAVETPTFMPVATHAHVRNLNMSEVAASSPGICLANTYHLLLRPGVEVLDRARHGELTGLHAFMRWNRGILTDSGGFQIFSLPGAREISEEGARFLSPYDNHPILLSPETSIATQQSLGSDIMMVLDLCVPSTSNEEVTRDAMERTHRWALRSLAARDAKDTGQAVFAIVQGGAFKPLRTQSAAFLSAHPFDGFAIGGLAVGEARELLYDTAQHTAALLPKDKTRYLMGVGTPIDLVEAVNVGIDMFDCILPSKMGQQGYAYTFEGVVRLARAEHRFSDAPLDAICACPVCTGYSRGYLRHLSQGDHNLAARLIGEHNLWHYQALMRRMRLAIMEDRWAQEYRQLRETLSPPNMLRTVPGAKAGAFELVTLRTGSRAVRHTGHGEIMHPVGPWVEANRLYVEQPRLVERLAQHDDEPLRILDVGLGAAANAVAALTAAQGLGDSRKRALEIVSQEVDVNALHLALADLEGFPFLKEWTQACASLLSTHTWEAPGLSWRLLAGDARETLDEADGSFDVIYFDPFSPASNPDLWTVEFTRRIRQKARYAGAQLITYSAATPTRVLLLLAGFFVGHGFSTGSKTGSKKETTIAHTHLDQLAEPLSERWLRRWYHSSSRGSHDMPLSDELAARIKAHPQFKAFV